MARRSEIRSQESDAARIGARSSVEVDVSDLLSSTENYSTREWVFREAEQECYSNWMRVTNPAPRITACDIDIWPQSSVGRSVSPPVLVLGNAGNGSSGKAEPVSACRRIWHAVHKRSAGRSPLEIAPSPSRV